MNLYFYPGPDEAVTADTIVCASAVSENLPRESSDTGFTLAFCVTDTSVASENVAGEGVDAMTFIASGTVTVACGVSICAIAASAAIEMAVIGGTYCMCRAAVAASARARLSVPSLKRFCA